MMLCTSEFSNHKGTRTKLGSVCRADQMQSNGPILRSLANFNIELEQFRCSLTAELACILSIGVNCGLGHVVKPCRGSYACVGGSKRLTSGAI